MKKYLIAIVLFLFIANIFNFSIYKTAFSVDQATCDQKAKQLGEYITTAQTNLKILYDDYNGGETDWLTGKKKNRKYWKDETSTTYPSDFSFQLAWPPIQLNTYSTIENYFTASGFSLWKEAMSNATKAANISDEMDSLGCSGDTTITTNTFAHPDNPNAQTVTFSTAKTELIPNLKKIAQQEADQQTTSTGNPYNSSTCQTTCAKNMSGWLKEGYCAALCLIDEAFTTFITWSINTLIAAAGVS